MSFHSTPEAIAWLESQTKSRPKTDLSKMGYAMGYFKVRLFNAKTFHVAGTNGKGTVVKFITNIAQAAGLTVGSFMSPYVYQFNERILINNQPIDDETLLELINMVYDFNAYFKAKFGEGYAFFELLTIMALVHFERIKVQVVVMEVGIGGLLDATNIMHYDMSIVTSIGFDHMKILGDTIEEIAYQKIGILKERGRVVTIIDDPRVIDVFMGRVQQMNGTLYHIQYPYHWEDYIINEHMVKFALEDEEYEIQMMGEHMVKNAIVAIEAVKRTMPKVSYDEIFLGLRNTTHHGRFEKLDFTPVKTIVDAAHNTESIAALAKTVRHLYGNQKVHLVLSVLGDKDIKEMVKIIKPAVDQIYLTGFPDKRYQSLAPYATDEMPYIEDAVMAYEAATAGSPDVVLVTGSIHFIGYFVKRLQMN